jgi:hypothetical protein
MVRPDDPEILGHVLLLRALVDTNWWKIQNGEPRVTSFAFTSGDEPSAILILRNAGISCGKDSPTFLLDVLKRQRHAP